MQLELDLDDRCQQLDFILKNTSTGAGDWRVYKVTKMSGFVYALGIRTPDPASQADHNYIETINREEAEWLIAERGISKGIGFD